MINLTKILNLTAVLILINFLLRIIEGVSLLSFIYGAISLSLEKSLQT